MFFKYLIETTLFDNGQSGSKSIEKLSPEENSPSSLCLGTRLIIILICGSK
jgi:hypothetical protein